MDQYLQAFILGNQAILTNVCLLPLYPGLVAFLAGNSADGQPWRGTRWLGLLVLAGVLTMMLGVGFVLFTFSRSFGAILPVLLPAIYAVVLVLGVLMLFGLNPFARLATTNVPLLRNRYVTAYLYGLLLGPMTLPCTGPIITSAFLLGANDFAVLAEGLLYFLCFGAGVRIGAGGASVSDERAAAAAHALAGPPVQAADAPLRGDAHPDRRVRDRDGGAAEPQLSE
jgi:cytochrome c-type biogenesis protein